MNSIREEITGWFKELQGEVCRGIEELDPETPFHEDEWKRPGGGGGLSRIIQHGKVFAKGGVNFSAVFGTMPQPVEELRDDKDNPFYATGVSIVMHPVNPKVPIIHMNVRYFESGDKSWFGGGIDLTPHYVNREEARDFHLALKKCCDQFDERYYSRFKVEADNYFFIQHRNETRGVGGIFFDRLPITEINMAFIKQVGKTFLPAYLPLVKANRNASYSSRELSWQKLRRGRYVEFNLVYDRGTRFGLETNGRTESILMSLPPEASWIYDYRPEPDSPEAKTLSFLKKNIDWIHG